MQVAAVSYDSVAILKKFSDKRSITFPLLADEKSTVIDAYQLRNKSSKQGIPHPATILIDRKGVVRANLPGTVRVRHSTEALLRAARELQSE